MVAELVKTKHANVSVRLDLDVLMEKLKEQGEEIEKLRMQNLNTEVLKEQVIGDEYDKEFPQLGGSFVNIAVKEGQVSWAHVM